MLLSGVSWIIVIHFSGVDSGTIYINYTVFKIVQVELCQTLAHTPVNFLFFRNCIDILLNITQCLKQPQLFTSFFTLVFPGVSIFHLQSFLQYQTVRVLGLFLLFQSSILCAFPTLSCFRKPRHTHLNLNHPLTISEVLDLFFVPAY